MCLQFPDDTVSVPTPRYQLYGITLKLTPKKDLLHQTFDSLSKMHPQVWVCCDTYDCMSVYDVTNDNDTQWNQHLVQHHLLGVTPNHDKPTLHGTRLDRMTVWSVRGSCLLFPSPSSYFLVFTPVCDPR